MALRRVFLPRLGHMLAAWGCLLAGLTIAAEPAAGPPRTDFGPQVVPVLKKYCYDCHSGDFAQANVALDQFTTPEQAEAKRNVWGKVLENMKGGLMPPPEADQPTAAEVAVVADWIEENLFKVDCNGPPNPGKVVIRRLNRAEYNNTIRDLVGIDFQPADDFPSDDVGYGFDNIGDVLSLPPILLEKYLTAAEEITERAIVAPETSDFGRQTYAGGSLRTSFGGRARGNQPITIASSGEVFAQHQFPAAAEYRITVRAWATQAGDEVAKFSLRLDGKEQQVFDVPGDEPAKAEDYQLTLTVPAGRHKVAAAFINDFYDPENKNPKRRDRNLIVERLVVQGPLDPSKLPLPETHRRIIPETPSPENESKVAQDVLSNFARRAWRRPVSDEEVARLMRIYDLVRNRGDSFPRGIQVSLQAVLVSPHFLFRVEQNPPGAKPDDVHPLSDYELASRLSYFLWSSMPDEELFELAEQGQLSKPDVLERQVRRMLKDPKALALAENFGSQWLTLRNLETVTPDPQVFPDYSKQLKADMRRETELFFLHIVEQDRNVLEFLNADYMFVNERLAKHYGLDGVRGEQFRQVDVPAGRRGGVLTQASILTVTSNPTRTSPVKRGKWVLEQLLGTPPPPPPPDVPELEEEKEVTGETLRERLEMHRANVSCANCHARMDPIGFGLENYNAIGAWREKDGKHAVDASGTLPSGESFDGPGSLKQILLNKKDQFLRCLAEKMLTYAIGRGVEYYDRCTIDRVTAAMEADDYRFSRLVLEIVKSDPFRLRKATGDRP